LVRYVLDHLQVNGSTFTDPSIQINVNKDILIQAFYRAEEVPSKIGFTATILSGLMIGLISIRNLLKKK